jgi:hypothetical protein
MPQLDSVTFLSQFFWLCVFFFGFYYLISKDFLPKMARIFKYRKTKMSFSGENKDSLQEEVEKVRATCKTLVENGLTKSSNLLSNNFQRTELWLKDVIGTTNKQQLPNETYLEWIGDNSIRQQITHQATAPLSTQRIFTNVFFATLFAKKKNGIYEADVGGPGDSLDQPLVKKAKRGAKKSSLASAGKDGLTAGEPKKRAPKKSSSLRPDVNPPATDKEIPKKITKKKLKSN